MQAGRQAATRTLGADLEWCTRTLGSPPLEQVFASSQMALSSRHMACGLHLEPREQYTTQSAHMASRPGPTSSAPRPPDARLLRVTAHFGDT